MYKIAIENNTTVDELKRLNNLTSNLLSIGQILKLPPKEMTQDNTYIVKSGDSLYKIAQIYNTTVSELINLNNLTSTTLKIGQVLSIPSSVVPSSVQTYTVKSGDSLYKIAQKYNTTVAELRRLNNLNSDLLSIGQVLKIN